MFDVRLGKLSARALLPNRIKTVSHFFAAEYCDQRHPKMPSRKTPFCSTWNKEAVLLGSLQALWKTRTYSTVQAALVDGLTT